MAGRKEEIRVEVHNEDEEAKAEEEHNDAYEEEVTAIKHNWKFVEEFINNISKKQEESTGETRKAINEAMEGMKRLASVQREREMRDEDRKRKEETSEDEESDSTDVEEKIWKEKVREEMKKEPKEEEINNGMISTLLSRIDNRRIIELEEFNEEVEDLHNYIEKFESYYEDNYKGGRVAWAKELEKYLTGGPLEELKIIQQGERSYEKIKERLLQWYDGQRTARKELSRKRFGEAKKNEEETMVAYSIRLLSLHRMAFPKRDSETSNTLIYKIRNAGTAQFKQMADMWILGERMRDKRINFKQIQKLARVYEEETKRRNDGEETKIIKINITQPQEKITSNQYQSAATGYTTKTNLNSQGQYHREPYSTTRPNQNQPFRYNNWQQQNPYQRQQNFQQQNRIQIPRAPPMHFNKACDFCGKIGHMQENCRKKLGTCFICGKRGHIARECWKSRNRDQQPQFRAGSLPPNRGFTGRRRHASEGYQGMRTEQPFLNCQPLDQPRDY